MSKKIFLSLIIFFANNTLLSFDFSMDKKKAEESFSSYRYQTLFELVSPEKSGLLKKYLETEFQQKGWLSTALDWFNKNKNEEDFIKNTIQPLDRAVIVNIAIYQYLFNAYNQLFNPSNLLTNLDLPSNIKEQLNAWTNKDFLEILIVNKDDAPSKNRINTYFNLMAQALIIIDPPKEIGLYHTIDEILDKETSILPKQLNQKNVIAFLEKKKKKSNITQKTAIDKTIALLNDDTQFLTKYMKDLQKNRITDMLITLARQWSVLPDNKRESLFQYTKKNNDDVNSFIVFLLSRRTNKGLLTFIKNGWLQHKDQKNAEKQQKPYVFLAELFYRLYYKKSKLDYRKTIEKYVADNKLSYTLLLEKIIEERKIFYTEFGTTDNTKVIEKWLEDAVSQAKKGKKTGKKEIKDYEEVDVREEPSLDLYNFLVQVIEYNPILYIKSDKIRKMIDEKDEITTLFFINQTAKALHSIAEI